MPLITPAYLDLQSKFHESCPEYGVSGHKHVDTVLSLSEQMQTRDILDYGCGKATLQKGLPFPIQNYDPCTVEYARRPIPANLVVCTDVFEHLEYECLGEVLDDIASLTKQMAFVNIACRPAKKFLPDGRNAHIIQETPNWWLTWILPRFELHSFQANAGSCIMLLRTPQKLEEAANDA